MRLVFTARPRPEKAKSIAKPNAATPLPVVFEEIEGAPDCGAEPLPQLLVVTIAVEVELKLVVVVVVVVVVNLVVMLEVIRLEVVLVVLAVVV